MGSGRGAGLPRLIVLNRLDRERASLERSLESLRARVRPHGHPDPAADRRGEELQRRRRSGGDEGLDLRRRTAAASRPRARFPADIAGAAQTAREALIEMVAEADDALMEKFFDAGTLTQDELLAGLKRGVAAGAHLPGRLHVGARPTSACSRCSTPSSPTCRRPPSGRSRATTPTATRRRRSRPTDGGPAAAFVWKTVADPFAGRITLFRVLSGRAQVRLDACTTSRSDDAGAARPSGAAAGQDADERARDQGRRHRRGGQAEGHADERLLADKGVDVTVPPITFPEPVISYAIEPKSRGDEEKISTALHRLQEEDPTHQLHPRSRRPRSCCSPARGSRTSRSPSRS